MSFQFTELQTLLLSEGKTLESCIYYLWNNRTNLQEPFVFIDKIELLFRDGQALMFGVTEDAAGITVNQQNDDIEMMKLKLLQDFNGAITVHTKAMDDTELWKPAIGQKILTVQSEKMSDGTYSNEAVLIEFENGYLIEISYRDDGLIAELFER